MPETLVINEIYLSIQGESTFAGLPCVFLRLTACNLRCSYCDTAYAFAQGEKMSLGEIRARIDELARPFAAQNRAPGVPRAGQQAAAAQTRAGASPAPPFISRLPLVELTGGEPLLQPASLPLMKSL